MTNSFQKLLKTCSKSFSKTKSKVHADPSTSSAQAELRVTSTSSGSNRFSAFSLIEISVVILIIGILVAGVTQSSKLIKYSRLNSARSLTQSSPVAGISDLMLWYETSLESSFESTEQSDGATVTTWYDNNPQSTVKNNATQSTSGYKPLFKEYVLNGGIPTVRFDGTDDYLDFSGTNLVGSSVTVFVVEQKRAAISNYGYFFGGSVDEVNKNFFLGYHSDTTIRFSSHGTIHLTTSSLASLAYSAPTPRVHTAILNSSSGRSYWLNGGATADKTDTETSTLTSFVGSALGRQTGSSTRYFNGDLAEIIIYTRALKTEERQAVEDYLSKKYAITIS